MGGDPAVHEARATARCDAAGRLAFRILCQRKHYLRAGRIAFEAARLVTLPTREAPRLYVRKGVSYRVFGEDGVVWVVQEVPAETAREGAGEPGKPPSAAPDAATAPVSAPPAG